MGLFNFDKLKNDLEAYVETRVELLKLEAKEQISSALGKIMVLLIISLLILLGVFFISAAIALKINIDLNSSYLGFIIVGVAYLLIGMSLWLFVSKNRISDKLSDKIREEINQG